MALSFLIDTSKGETPESVNRKRALAAAIMGQMGPRSARNVGEGIGNALSSIGSGITANVLNRRADAASSAGQDSATSAFDSIRSSLMGFPAAPSSAGTTAATAPSGGGNFRDAIASIESAGSGDYGAIGPTHKTLGRALGRYQVMEANIGPWSREALGREVTPEEFLANPEIQDAIFDHRFGSYVKKFGNPQDAASAWFTGQPLSVGANRRDVLGTTGNQYVDKFNRALGSPAVAANEAMATGDPVQTASLDPSIGMATPRSAAPDQKFQVGAPASYTPAGQRVLSTMMNPQPMGGAPMPLQAGSAAPQASPPLPFASMQPPAPAPQPVQVAQAQPMPEMAGNVPDMRGQSSGPSLEQLIQAASNPWLNDSQRAVVNLLLKQHFEANDPSNALDAEFRRAQIANMQSQIRERDDPNARDKFGNSVIWGQDADGKWVAMQPSSGGGLVPATTPDGINLVPPGISNLDLGNQFGIRDRAGNIISTVDKNLTAAEAEKAAGKAQGEAQFDLPRVEQNALQTLAVLERMKTHPGREGATGFIQGALPSRSADQVDFQSLVDQTQGQSFLQAFQMLKGGGQITEAEGQKATVAISRLGNQRLSDADYLQAIRDLEEVVNNGLARARKQAGVGEPAPASGGADYKSKYGLD